MLKNYIKKEKEYIEGMKKLEKETHEEIFKK